MNLWNVSQFYVQNYSSKTIQAVSLQVLESSVNMELSYQLLFTILLQQSEKAS